MKRVSYLLLLSLSLAACGGGGGGSTSTNPPVTNKQANVRHVDVQRALAQQTLQTQQMSATAISFGPSVSSSTTTGFALRRNIEAVARRATSAWRPGIQAAAQGLRRYGVTYGTCTNGTESATIDVSASEVQLYERDFYDAACTSLYEDVYLDVIAQSSSSGSATGTLTRYTTSGTVFEYNTVELAMTGIGTASPQITVQLTDAPNATAPQLAAVGLSCGASSTSASCGAAAVVHSQTLSQDAAMSMLMSVSESVSGSTITVPISGSAASYTAALNAISIAPMANNFPSWTVSASSALATADSAALSGKFTFTTSGIATGGSLTLTDSADDGTAILTLNSQGITGVIKQTDTGASVATFTVDANGNGTIAYSNGTTGQIVNWQVLS